VLSTKKLPTVIGISTSTLVVVKFVVEVPTPTMAPLSWTIIFTLINSLHGFGQHALRGVIIDFEMGRLSPGVRDPFIPPTVSVNVILSRSEDVFGEG
jgi:hypothetical protein